MYGYSSNHDSGGDKCHHSDHYDTKTAAENAAERMGKSGAHRMSCKGKTVYMPGESHGDYMDINDGGPTSAGIDPSDFGL